MKYRVIHKTEFIYEARVELCHNESRLLPRILPSQAVDSAALHIDPVPYDYYERLDYFGNRTSYFSIQQPHDHLTVTATSVVSVTEVKLLDQAKSIPWESVGQHLHNGRSEEIVNAFQYVLDSPMIHVDNLLIDYARPSFPPQKPLDEAVHDLMHRIYSEFRYDPEFSSLATPLKDVMEYRSGVCQDFAHLAIGCLRAQGLPARYVSGYIETQPPPGKKRLVGADASHAWFSVFFPGLGWLDYDPTNNQLPGERHVTVAWGRDYSDVTPLKGVAYGSGDHELKIAVDVLPLK